MDSDPYLSWLTELLGHIEVYPPDYGAVIALILAVLLLGCSGFVSASEVAFFSLSPNEIGIIEQGRSEADNKILLLCKDSERLLATILISNNFVNVAIIMLFNYFFGETISWGDDLLDFLFMTVLLTFLLLLFGEIMPKFYSSQHSLSFCRKAAPTLLYVQKIFHPLSSLLVRSQKIADKVPQKDDRSISVDDLEQALELTDKKDIAEEKSLLKGIIRFGGEMAREIMTPRTDVVDLNMKTPYPDVLRCVVESNFSRIPVYAETEDNIKGVLYIKDLLPHLNKPANFRWQSLIRPPYFVPETKMIDDLLKEFQTNKVHIAIVVDEFGGTSGIVTMEDIIEEIVGEINDEYDEEECQFVRLNANTYVFEGKILLTDFFKIVQLDDDFFTDVEGDADTLAGLLLEIKGEFPERREVIRYKNVRFDVLEMDNRRITKIKVVVGAPMSDGAQDAG